MTLEVEVVKDQGRMNGLKILHGVLHGLQWIMLYSLSDLVSSSCQRDCGSNTKLGDHDTTNSYNP